MWARWFAFWVVLGTVGCQRVVLTVESPDEHIHMVLPYFLLEGALSFTDEQELCIDDLAGIDADLDLCKLAKALRESSDDQFQIEMIEGQQHLRLFRQGDWIKCEIRQHGTGSDGEIVDLFLPMALFDLIEDHAGETISQRDILEVFRDVRGTLIELHDGDEYVKIVLK